MASSSIAWHAHRSDSEALAWLGGEPVGSVEEITPTLWRPLGRHREPLGEADERSAAEARVVSLVGAGR